MRPKFHGQPVTVLPTRPELLESGHILWFLDDQHFLVQEPPLDKPALHIYSFVTGEFLGEVRFSDKTFGKNADGRTIFKPLKCVSLRYRRVAVDVLDIVINAHKLDVVLQMSTNPNEPGGTFRKEKPLLASAA